MAAISTAETLITKIKCLHLEEEWYDTPATHITNIALVVINSLTALSAIVGNILILLAVTRTPALRTPSNTLLCCLAFADFLVGLVVQPMNALQIVFELQRNVKAFCVTEVITTGSLSWICAGVSFLVISAIAVERFLAIKLHLRYEELVTVRRVLFVVLCFWIICTTLIVARFLGASYDALVITIVVMDVTSIAITVAAYFKIYLQVSYHHCSLFSSNLDIKCKGLIEWEQKSSPRPPPPPKKKKYSLWLPKKNPKKSLDQKLTP